MSALRGACLCGAARFTATPIKLEMDTCHCSMCRRWTGGAWFSVFCHDLTFDNAGPIATFGSSDWGERGFCTRCGSTLFWRMKDGGMITVSAQAFEDPSQFKFASEIFIDEKPANYAFANETHKMTGAEAIAALTGMAQSASDG